MVTANLSEAEIQVLASIYKADTEYAPTDIASLDADGERYWLFKENWSGAYPGLQSKGLIQGDDTGFQLTENGRPLGERYFAEQPDMYWYYYQKFYSAARKSAAHSKLCIRVFGEDLTQEGMTDMPALNYLVDLLELKAGDHVVDLGCGAGVIAEYISDKTGAKITGLDYSKPAIIEAQARTKGKRSKLSFTTGDINALDLPEQSFDAIISIDTLYWVADMVETVRHLAKLLRVRPESL